MKSILSLMLIAAGVCTLSSARSHSDSWPMRSRQTIEKTLPLSAPPARVIVDNIDGYVHVTGSAGDQVRVTAHEIIRAETESDLAEARSEVKLDITGTPGTVSVYYNAPWRCDGPRRGCADDHRRRFYNVTYDIDIQVPHEARTAVSTVNNGDLRVDNLAGDFDAGNVNGAISMRALSGSGDVHTVNGPIWVQFARNPARPCSFKSVNGEVDVFFPRDLSADLLFKTFNGQVYSDFDVAPRTTPAAVTEHRGGKYVYRSDRVGGRAGSGGPELSFDTLNGNVRLHHE
jgi:hypothetical protein